MLLIYSNDIILVKISRLLATFWRFFKQVVVTLTTAGLNVLFHGPFYTKFKLSVCKLIYIHACIQTCITDTNIGLHATHTKCILHMQTTRRKK